MKNEDGKITCSYRLNPDTVRRIEQWHKANGCEHKNEFIENAVNFYVSYLTLHDNNALLPTAVKSVIDGRLGQFEEHMAYLLFKQAVETDMVATLNATAYEWSDDTLHKLRKDSVRNVKETNGRISFEQHVRGLTGGDDEWLD